MRLLRQGETIGVFTLAQSEAKPFNTAQIEFVENFAAQAVVAIENTRLLNELRQSLEQQTATADVLQVISSTPGDLKPCSGEVPRNAARICEAKAGNIYRWEDNGLRLVESHNTPPAFTNSWVQRRCGRQRTILWLGC